MSARTAESATDVYSALQVTYSVKIFVNQGIVVQFDGGVFIRQMPIVVNIWLDPQFHKVLAGLHKQSRHNESPRDGGGSSNFLRKTWNLNGGITVE